MANQTELLNVSDEMKLDDMRQELCGSESDEKLCSSSLDTTEELYSSLATDTLRDSSSLVRKISRFAEIMQRKYFLFSTCLHLLTVIK